MGQQIDATISAVTEDQRALHAWDCRRAAMVLQVHPNAIGRWWVEVERRLVRLAIDQPGATAAMLGLVLAKAEAEQRRRRQRT